MDNNNNILFQLCQIFTHYIYWDIDMDIHKVFMQLLILYLKLHFFYIWAAYCIFIVAPIFTIQCLMHLLFQFSCGSCGTPLQLSSLVQWILSDGLDKRQSFKRKAMPPERKERENKTMTKSQRWTAARVWRRAFHL